MLIRCVACNKLIYSDDALEDNTCPACGSTQTEQIAMGFIFDREVNQAVSVPKQPVKAPEPVERSDVSRGKH